MSRSGSLIIETDQVNTVNMHKNGLWCSKLGFFALVDILLVFRLLLLVMATSVSSAVMVLVISTIIINFN